MKKKFLRLSFKHRAVEGHLEERHNLEWNGKMPRTLMNMMGNFEFSIVGVVDVGPMFSGMVAQAFSRLADVSAFAVGADKKVNDVFCFASHFSWIWNDSPFSISIE